MANKLVGGMIGKAASLVRGGGKASIKVKVKVKREKGEKRGK